MKEVQGFIKLHRNIINWEWYDCTNVKIIFIHLLLLAQFADTKWQGVDLKAGQVVTSVNTLSTKLKLTTQQVRGALAKLQRSGEITIQTTSKFTLITIENWAFYQNSEAYATNKTTNEQQTDNKRITNKQQQYKKYKNYKNDKNNAHTPSYDVDEFESRAIPLPVYHKGDTASGI